MGPRTYAIFLISLFTAAGICLYFGLFQRQRILQYLKTTRQRWGLFFVSATVTFFALEVMLRLYLVHARADALGLKKAHWYARSHQDDYWILFHRWEGSRWAVKKDGAGDGHGTFYDHWGLSLQPDALLGYSRRASVNIPGHETTNLATRGIKDYARTGPKILFYGDSWVESEAPSSDTLPAKMERRAGIDCLNYGVGGYALDQIYLLFDQTWKQFDAKQSFSLIGLIKDDAERMLLKVRTSPKPFYSLENGRLILHKDHIDARDLNKYFIEHAPSPRLYLLELLLAKTGLGERLRHSVQLREDAMSKSLAAALIKEFKKTGLAMGFVLFSDWSDGFLRVELQKHGIPCLDMQAMHKQTGIPYPASHPTSPENDIYADWIIAFLRREWKGMPQHG